jgi:hypothetical protein
MCDVAHISFGIGKLLVSRRSRLGTGSARAMEGAMPSINLWSRGVPRVELDQRSREARLRLERIEPLVVSRATVAHSWFWRLVSLLSGGRDRGAPRGKRVRRPLNNRRPSRVPTVLKALALGGLYPRRFTLTKKYERANSGLGTPGPPVEHWGCWTRQAFQVRKGVCGVAASLKNSSILEWRHLSRWTRLLNLGPLTSVAVDPVDPAM